MVTPPIGTGDHVFLGLGVSRLKLSGMKIRLHYGRLSPPPGGLPHVHSPHVVKGDGRQHHFLRVAMQECLHCSTSRMTLYHPCSLSEADFKSETLSLCLRQLLDPDSLESSCHRFDRLDSGTR